MDLKDYKGGRLNLNGFIEKAVPMTELEFNKTYINGNFEIYSEKSIVDFQKAVSSDLVKGVIEADGLKYAQKQLQSLERVEFMKGEAIVGVYVKRIEEPSNEFEKGQFTDSFQYSNDKLSFTKTGKEISTQITSVLLPVLEAQKVRLETELAEVSKDISIDPDSNVDSWEYKGFSSVLPKVGYYSYQLCESKWDSVSQTYGELTDEKKCCQKYNGIARNLVSTMADIQYATILARNIDGTKKYELTANQIIALQF